MAVTVMAAAARMEATMIAVMVFSPFTDFLPCSAGGDQSDHDGCGGDDDGGNDEFHGFFSSLFFGQRVAIRVTITAADAKMEVTMIAVMIFYLFLFYFRGSLCPPRHPYNTTTRTKFVRVVKFDALFVIF